MYYHFLFNEWVTNFTRITQMHCKCRTFTPIAVFFIQLLFLILYVYGSIKCNFPHCNFCRIFTAFDHLSIGIFTNHLVHMKSKKKFFFNTSKQNSHALLSARLWSRLLRGYDQMRLLRFSWTWKMGRRERLEERSSMNLSKVIRQLMLQVFEWI